MKTILNSLMILAMLVILTCASAGVAQAQSAITIGPDTLLNAVYLSSYSQQLTASGGAEPYIFSLVGGSLPAGFSLSSGGMLSGFPSYLAGSVPGSYPITIEVKDTNSVTASRDYSFVLDKATPTMTGYASGAGIPDVPIYWNHPFTLWAELRVTNNGSSYSVQGTAKFSIDGTTVPECQAVPLDGFIVVCRDVSMNLSLGAHTFKIDYLPVEYGDYYYSAAASGTFTAEPGAYTIVGTLFKDDNQDGIYDYDSEQQLYESGWTINLDQDCDTSVEYTTTTTNGGFEFSNMPGGHCYRITEVVGSGWQQTAQPADFWLSNHTDSIYFGNYYPTITVSPDELPAGSVGVEYNQAFIAAGGAEPYTYTIYESDLPAGLALSEGGVFSGTPTAAGVYYFTIMAEDANHTVGMQSYRFSIITDGVFTFTSSSSPSAPGDPVIFTLSGAGDAVYPPVGPITFSADGAPIEGCPQVYLNLSMDPYGIGDYPATCTTTALTEGTHEITASYTDATGFYNSTTLTLMQVVKQSGTIMLTIGPDTLPDAVFETPYNQQITASGGDEPYTFSLTSGNLPNSITLNSSGLLSGNTDFYVESVPGTYPITIQVQDAHGDTASRDYTFVLDKAMPTVTAYSSGYPMGTIYWKHPFDLWVDVTNDLGNGQFIYANGTVAFSVDGDPVPECQAVVLNSGFAKCENISMSLDLGEHTYKVDYVPAGYEGYYYPAVGSGPLTVEPGSYSIMGSLFSDNDQDGIQDADEYRLWVSWTINLDQGCDGDVDFTTTTSGGDYQFNNIPGGQCYRVSEVIGEPGWQQTTQPADFWLSSSIYWGLNFGNYYPNITFSPQAELPPGKVGVAYNQVFIASGGAEPYTYTIADGDLTSSLTLSEDGVLSGIPTVTAMYQFRVRAEDANHAVGNQWFVLRIKTDGVFTFTSSSNPSNPGDPVIFTISATGNALYYGSPVPPAATVTFFADGTVIQGCSDLLLDRAVVNGRWDFGNYPATCTTAALETGTHQITASYHDYFGVYNTPTLALTQMVSSPDSTPPDTSLSGEPANPSSDSTPTFTFTGTDNLTPTGSLAFECKLDSAGFAACASPYTAPALSDGEHTFQVRAIDAAGNIDPTPASFAWLVNTQSTAVMLASFTTWTGPEGVRLEWSTVQEIDLLGFRVYSAASVDVPPGERQLLTPELLPALQPGQAAGASYAFTDSTQQWQRVFYWLEAAYANGSEVFGPMLAGRLLIYLPGIRR